MFTQEDSNRHRIRQPRWRDPELVRRRKVLRKQVNLAIARAYVLEDPKAHLKPMVAWPYLQATVPGGYCWPCHHRLEMSFGILQDIRPCNSQIDLLTKNLPPPYEFRISPPRLPYSVPVAVFLSEHTDLLFTQLGQEAYMKYYFFFDVWEKVRVRIPHCVGHLKRRFLFRGK